MREYTPPLRDIRFVFEHVADLAALSRIDVFAHAGPELVMGLLEEAGRFCAQAIAPTNRPGDLEGSRLVEGGVVTPAPFKAAYRAYVEAGWGSVPFEPEHGGGGFPWLVGLALQELITSANMAFSLCPLLTQGAIEMLEAHGSDEQQHTYLPRMVTGEWTGTMNLTEPQAGSDLGALTTRAVPHDDGSYRITGQKIFISYGDHDLAENIVHLVLARLPDAPPGTRGISVFIVPKYLVDEDGGLGDRNDVEVVSLEHKLGIHASPTCVMAYGDKGGGAVGYLVGEPHGGMRYMFTMMNNARLSVGLEGLAVGERAFQMALAFARERRQGTAPLSPQGQASRIIDHPDVRRMLMTMKAYNEAMRCLLYTNAQAIDLARHHPDEDVRAEQQKLADLLTPVSKAWCTDLGVELTSLAVQIHGGMGYVEETGVAQLFRDARIAPIYEGTNGIQAIDLVGRKLPYDGGAHVKGFIARIRDTADTLDGELSGIGDRLRDGAQVLEQATDWIFEHAEEPVEGFAAATPYLRIFGQVVGGWFLARSAAAARTALEDAAPDDAAFHATKIATARFYADHLLPLAAGYLPAVTAGSDDLFAIASDQLGA